MKTELSKIAQDLEKGRIDEDKARTLLFGLLGVIGSLICWVKDTAENEKILIRESKNGLKYLIFDDDSISYAKLGKKIGEYEIIHFDETNGKSILAEFSNDR